MRTQIMPGPQGENRVEGAQVATAGGEVESVGVAIEGKSFTARFGELRLVERKVGLEPSRGQHRGSCHAIGSRTRPRRGCGWRLFQ